MTLFTKTFILTLLVSSASLSHATMTRNASDNDNADASMQKKIQTLIDTDAGLSPTNSITVQSIDGVVYLHGLVDVGGKRRAESIASKASGGQRIVNAIEEGP